MAKREAASKVPPRRDGVGEDAIEATRESGDTISTTKVRASDKAATKKVATVTVTDIGDHLAATFDIPKSHAKIYLTEAIALIGKQLKKGTKVRLSGLGTLQVKKRAARKVRNPSTGEEMKVKAGRRVVFAAAQDLKAKL